MTPTHGITYALLIASPLDVIAERNIVSACARDWNSAHASSGLQVRDVRWELDAIPAIRDRPQAIINDQLVDSADILIGIFKARIGTPTSVAASGTIEEIARFVAADKPVMLYFSNGPIPHDHNPEQFRLLREYKKQIASRAIYAEFENEADLQQKVSRHLASTMARINSKQATPAPSQKPESARVFIRSRPGQKIGEVKIVRVSAMIENISPVDRITRYVCTISLPKACLTHSSPTYMDVVSQDEPTTRKVFRRSESSQGADPIIFSGDKLQIFAIDIGVDQLKMTGTYLAGDYEGTMADKLEVDAIVEGDTFHVERTIADIFANPTQG